MTSARTLASDVAAQAVALRRAIHRRPELGFEEYETTAAIAEALTADGIAVRVRGDGAGLVAEVGSGGPVVAFRADLDALPIIERTPVAYASEIHGRMHACGHDVHAAIGVGIARALHRLGDELPGRVRFLFQPGEEVFPGGAATLIREGALEGVEALVAFHVDPSLDTGKVGLLIGPITSSSDRFIVTLEGPGGHTARPHETVDTIYAVGKIIAELPSLIHRNVDARIPLVVVFGQVHGGSADNVIPDLVTASGTVRLLDIGLWERMPELLDRLVRELATPTGAKTSVEYIRGIPPVANDASVIACAEYAIATELGTGAVAGTRASMGAEDFADYLVHVPGALLRLGVRRPDGPELALHSALFDIDETAIETGIAAGVATLRQVLREL